ncbi:hypothetical protein [Thermaerobacillus caldiproteolyticus]|uniref:hypothetical protein n=1 Tax=Thermaerobacillus caldiproteolyticus TaxID=247480 RepID=UPI0018F2321C|nr:hypothetical protein [Anoxybacillus caldiproteolyticus]
MKKIKKYFNLISIIILTLILFNLPHTDYRLTLLGMVVGFILAKKGEPGLLKCFAFVVFTLCIMYLLLVVLDGILMGGAARYL